MTSTPNLEVSITGTSWETVWPLVLDHWPEDEAFVELTGRRRMIHRLLVDVAEDRTFVVETDPDLVSTGLLGRRLGCWIWCTTLSDYSANELRLLGDDGKPILRIIDGSVAP